MSPRTSFHGPARQRGAIGLVAAATFGLALLIALLVVDSGRLYLEQRKLQRVADNAALEAVSRGGNCLPGLSAATYAGQSAVRNAFIVGTTSTLTTTCGTLVTNASNMRTFAVDATQAAAVKVVATNTVTTTAVLALQALFSGATVSANTQLTATAVAASPKPTLAQLSIRSTLLSVDTARSNLLNPLFSNLLGGNVSLSAVGWNGLVNTNINLLQFMNQLAIQLGVSAGNYTALLQAQGTVTQFLQAAATVAAAGGATADVAIALANLQVGAINAPGIKLGDILQLQTGTTAAGLDASVQLFQLVQAFVQLANKNSAAAVALPVNLLGLVGVNTTLKVIQPPQFSAVGNPALAAAAPLGVNQIYVKTAQVRVLTSVSSPLIDGVLATANTLLSVVVGLINTLLSDCLLGSSCTQTDLQVLPSLSLDVGIEAGVGSSYVTNYSCTNSPTSTSLTATTNISALQVKVGRINPALWFSSNASAALTPITLVDVGTLACQGPLGPRNCAPRVPFGGGGSQIMIDSPVLGSSDPNFIYNNPKPINVTPTPLHVVTVSNAVGSLSGTLGGITLISYPPTLSGSLLGALLNTLTSTLNTVLSSLMSVISGVLSPLVDPIVNSLLFNLGINVNEVDVGFNLTCGQTGKAYLVI